MPSSTPYSFYPVKGNDSDDGKHVYTNGALFARRRTASSATTRPTSTSTTTSTTTRRTTSTATTSSTTTTHSVFPNLMPTSTTSLLPTEENFCHCGNCGTLPTTVEKKCCYSESLDLTNFQDVSFIQGETCILTSNLLVKEVLGTTTVQLQWFRQQRYKGHRGDELLFSNMTHRNYRYHAYRNYIDFVHGYLGKHHRKVIPACVVTHIRQKWPDPDGAYVGYRHPPEADTTDEPQADFDEVELFTMDSGN